MAVDFAQILQMIIFRLFPRQYKSDSWNSTPLQQRKHCHLEHQSKWLIDNIQLLDTSVYIIKKRKFCLPAEGSVDPLHAASLGL